jgi:transposase-like protein
VETLDGSSLAKERLRVVLRVLVGELTVEQGCKQLGIRPSRFHAMRQEVLQGGLDALEPKPRGRPALAGTPAQQRIAALEDEAEALRREVRAAQIREELALVLPYVLHERQPPPLLGGKKTAPAAQGSQHSGGPGPQGSPPRRTDDRHGPDDPAQR